MSTRRTEPHKLAFRNLVASAMLAFALVLAFVAYQLQVAHQQALSAARLQSSQTALILENFLQTHFQAIELTLAIAAEDYALQRSQGRFTESQYSQTLSSLQRRLPATSALRATDAAGLVRYGTGVDTSMLLSVAARRFFKDAQSAARGTTARTSPPFRSRMTGHWVLPTVRALVNEKGEFDGVVYALTDVSHLAHLFASVDVGHHGVISLFDAQRRVLIRHPALDNQGDEETATLGAQRLRDALDAGLTETSFSGVSTLDGIDRTMSYRRVGDMPMYALVGMAREDFMAAWWREVATAVAFVMLLGLTTLALCTMLWRAWARREAAMAQLLAKEAALNDSMDALRASEERFRTLTTGLPQMVWTADAKGHADFFSPRWSQYTGIPNQNLLDLATRMAVFHPEDLPHVSQAWRQAVAEGRLYQVVGRIRRHDGQWRVFDSRALPQRDASGRIVAWIGSNTDITEAREAHDELLRAKQAADEASHAKSAFLATISHEIRTPLNGVLGFAHIGQREAEPGSRSALNFSRIRHSGQLLLALINDLLDFSKIEAGKLQLESSPIDLQALLEEQIALMQPRADSQGIHLSLNITPQCPQRCMGDALRLQQVLMNLLANAVKFTEQGSVVLEADHDGNQLSMRIIDTGIGISAAQLPRLFMPFEQADSSSTTRRFGGTGLGLAITHRLVNLMGGSIRVSSVLGAGSVFEVQLPFRALEPKLSGPLDHDQATTADGGPSATAT
jgi:PAS domain S-box-containing protein